MSMCSCARPGCSIPAKSSCSGCGREQYCSSTCQKADWKMHKSLCPILKKLSTQPQPFREVLRTIEETLQSYEDDRRFTKHLLSYVEYQFGEEIPGKDYRQRECQASNWLIDVYLKNKITCKLGSLYMEDMSLGNQIRVDMSVPYFERSFSLLNPYLIKLDSDLSNGIDSLDEEQRNKLLEDLNDTHRHMITATMIRRQFDLTDKHCQRCLAYARRYGLEGEEKTTMIFNALYDFCGLREREGKLSEAMTFAEECYNFVAEAYDPVHPQVQKAAGSLIRILIKKGDLVNAERYAQVTYSSLRDKKNMDQDGVELAVAAFNLSTVIFRQGGNIVKAEELAREAIRIRILIDHKDLQTSLELLASILVAQRNFGDETKGLYERSLALVIKNEGLDSLNAAHINLSIATFYIKFTTTQTTISAKMHSLLLIQSHLKEALRVYSKIHGSAHESTVTTQELLTAILRQISAAPKI